MQRVLTFVCLCVLAVTSLVMPRQAGAQGTRLCFNVPAVVHCIEGRFREYWEQNGGLAVFGYPITGPAQEYNRDTKQTYLTQWFERNRFELHPENARPYDVLLGRLADDRLRQEGRDWQRLPKVSPSAPHYFTETGHAITHAPFWSYWRTHGLEFDGRSGTSFAESLALFGYPISEPVNERNRNGDMVLTQWFERARFEWHPTNPEPFRVLLDLLGREVIGALPPDQGLCMPIIPELRRNYEEGRTPGRATYRDALGCPQEVRTAAAAEQVFENGRMLWHSSFYPRTPGTIYAAYRGSYPMRYERYADLWKEGDPETGGLTPPANAYEPKRGFGKVWREQPGVRERLGWAIQPERPEEAVVVGFQRGTMVWLKGNDHVYIFIGNSDIMTLEARLK